MTTLQEGDLVLRLPTGANGRKFDDRTTHGLSHCMKAVDFIVELPDKILFVEFKDPEDPAAVAERSEEFVSRFTSGSLDKDLATKYRDSFLYEWAAERLDKPVHYLVLVALSSLDAAMLLTRTDGLKRSLPWDGPANGIWKRRIADHCAVLNIAAWNKAVASMPVARAGP